MKAEYSRYCDPRTKHLIGFAVHSENGIKYKKIKSRSFSIEDWFYLILLFKDGRRLRIDFDKDFWLDGRSGGRFVDVIYPNWPKRDIAKAPITMHDALYHDFHDLPFELANELLYDMILLAGYSSIIATLLYKGVSTPFARKAFGCDTDFDIVNRAKLNVRWI